MADKDEAETSPVGQEKSDTCVAGGDGKSQTANTSDSKISPPAAAKTRHDWYQTESHVILAVMLKSVKKEDLTVNIEPKSVCVTVKLSAGDNYELNLDLAHTVMPEQSQIKLLNSKIEVKLKKAEGTQWASLEDKGEKSNVKQFSPSGGPGSERTPGYPTSSQIHTDWDKLASQVAAEEKDEKKEGDAALNQLFQQIYADGSDDVKKAMMKSFYESGGTVLSTNWDEIGSKKVEVKPPDGMEYRKWDT